MQKLRSRRIEVTAAHVRDAAAHRAIRNSSGLAPLHYAAKSEYCREIAEALLASGADINVQDKVERTPLDYATDFKLDRMVEFFAERGGRSGKN